MTNTTTKETMLNTLTALTESKNTLLTQINDSVASSDKIAESVSALSKQIYNMVYTLVEIEKKINELTELTKSITEAEPAVSYDELPDDLIARFEVDVSGKTYHLEYNRNGERITKLDEDLEQYSIIIKRFIHDDLVSNSLINQFKEDDIRIVDLDDFVYAFARMDGDLKEHFENEDLPLSIFRHWESIEEFDAEELLKYALDDVGEMIRYEYIDFNEIGRYAVDNDWWSNENIADFADTDSWISDVISCRKGVYETAYGNYYVDKEVYC